jgi:serine/threonine protein kinase
MDRPPYSTPGNLPPDNARAVKPQQESSHPSDLPTLGGPADTGTAAGHSGSPTLTVLNQRYDILGEAGRGAMGQVYKARDRETGDTVALKLLKPEIASDQAMVERFKSELLFARKITHKNVCRVHEFNRIGGIAYTSMEFVEGENLRSVLNRFGNLTLRKGMDLALQMCSGLKEAHAQGIVHRDLKPENVMIDAQGNLKIMDFGIARSLETLSNLTGAMTGTPAYMAPEQALGKPVDGRTDIYALGLMMYEMFTGTQAFHADNAIALALKQTQESPAPPREIEPSLPVPLEDAILKCIEKDPAERFQSVAALETALRSQLPSVAPDLTATISDTRSPTGRSSVGRASDQKPADPRSTLPTGQKRIATSLSVQSRQRSNGLWVIVAILLIGASATLYLWHGMEKQKERRAEALASLRQSSLGLAPAVTDQTPTAPLTKVSTDVKPLAVPAPPAIPPPKSKKNDLPTPHIALATPAAASHSETATSTPPKLPASAAASDQTAEAAASGEPSTSEASKVPGSGGVKNRPAYIWVGRFPREAGAEHLAKQIEAMGLPVTVMPRHNPKNNSDFFAVFTGPFAANRIDDVMKDLQVKGFSNTRKVGGLGLAEPPPTP